MFRDRYTRRTYAGNQVPRRPVHPRLLRRRGAALVPPSRLPRVAVRLLAALLLITVAVSGSGAGVAYSAYAQTAASLKPRLAALDGRELFQTSRIYDRNGALLYEFFDAGKRTNVEFEEISPLLVQATVAIEDKTFFTNPGIDLAGIARTLWSSLQAGEETGGGSTITQQVIKNSVLTVEERAPDKRYERKIKEIILAQELDDSYSKEQVLELYLNENFYGNLAYGIEAASEVYFGVRAKDLNLSQAALLAGLPQLPTLYNPINYLERDEQGGYLPPVRLEEGWLDPAYQLGELTPPRWRQIAVLRRMVEDGYVSEAEARAAVAQPLRFVEQEVPLNAPHFVFYVRDLLLEKYGNEILNGGGLRITTTLDLDMQRMVQQKAYERITELEERNIHNAAVVVMQPNTGQVLSMVGSIDYNAVKGTTSPGETGNVLDGQVNVATRERQPGSALKPFTFLSAMEQGATPETVWWDVPTEFPITGGQWYTPLNYNGRFNGPVRMRTALANSLNLPAVKALKFAGIENTLNLLDRVGIKTGLKRGQDFYGLSLTLGGGEVTPLELTTAYNTLASGGHYHEPVAILKITDATGRVLEQFRPNPGEEVVKPELAAIISDMLSDDRARQAVWGLNSPLKLSLPAAVKTGTTNDWRDAWAAGYTPFVTVGVWTGNNNNEATAKVESLTGGGIIWRNVMEELFVWIKERPRYAELFAEPFPGGVIPTEFTLPPDGSVQRRAVCELPGSFGGYNEELFTKTMLTAMISPTTTLQPGPELDRRIEQVKVKCDAFQKVTVVRVPQPEDWSAEGELRVRGPAAPAEGEEPTADDATTLSASAYCRPSEGVAVPPGLTREIYIWKVPPPDPSEKVQYTWSGGSAGSAVRVGDLPACTAEMFEPPVPKPPVEGAVLMPELRRLGENQAKDALAALGIYVDRIYVDYQTRDRIPDVFDQFVPYAVVSTVPAAGEWILPGTTVVLGVRSPSETAAPEPAPTEPQPAPGDSQAPPPDQGQPPPDQAPPPDQGQPPPDQGQPPPDQGQPPTQPQPVPIQPIPLPQPGGRP